MTKTSTKPIDFWGVLDLLTKNSKNEQEKGKNFENLILKFLKTDRQYKERFDNVWFSDKFPDRHKIKLPANSGIDLIARERITQKYCAIQCKFYSANTSVNDEHISKFIAEVNDDLKNFGFESMILVYTGKGLTNNAERKALGSNVRFMDEHMLANSSIDWSTWPNLKPRKILSLKEHQKDALAAAKKNFAINDRGSLIMACGTGKTLVSKAIAENIAGLGKTVLYLVPSISLIQQSMREWANNAVPSVRHYYIAVCSDKTVDRDEQGRIEELESGAVSTNKDTLVGYLKNAPKDAMTVIFSTYQSIEVVKNAVAEACPNGIDLALCDEAHRTAGHSKRPNKSKRGTNKKIQSDKFEESYFLTIHKNSNIKIKKRLYMTATPKIYNVKDKTKKLIEKTEDDFLIYSMDDETKFGPVFYEMTFGKAIRGEIRPGIIGEPLLSDFQVRVAVIDPNFIKDMLPKTIDPRINKMLETDAKKRGEEMSEALEALTSDGAELRLNETVKLAALWRMILDPEENGESPMLQRVIAFFNTIKQSKVFAYTGKEREGHKIKWDQSSSSFEYIVNAANTKIGIEKTAKVKHIDGSNLARVRKDVLKWLKDSDVDKNTCRIVSNAKCLAEGIDVPALDAVAFMNPRESMVDIVQSVGRVMRKAKNKKIGYVILPVAVKNVKNLSEELNKGETFKSVWKVLNALRAHDKSLVNKINKISLEKANPIQKPPPGTDKEQIIITIPQLEDPKVDPELLANAIHMIKYKMVEKVGEIDYYDKYGMVLGNVSAKIKDNIINKLKGKGNTAIKKAVNEFNMSLKGLINDSVSRDETIKIIAHHFVLSRVFDMLFPDKLTHNNPVAEEFEIVTNTLDLDNDMEILGNFYNDVKEEVERIKTSSERQEFIKKIYGTFLKSADKKESAKHGVVYTPVAIADFIIHSIEEILRQKFNVGFDDPAVVRVLEPFAGTGMFVTRLLESGLITRKNLPNKYLYDINANEITLLAFYVATLNIESVYQRIMGNKKRVRFHGMHYTDTLELDPFYHDSKQRRRKQIELNNNHFQKAQRKLQSQKESCINIIMGNPPYSAGQKSFDDENSNKNYPELKQRISDTYGKGKLLRDSYVHAIRWTSDRIGKSGIIGFVTNASFLRSKTGAGMRAALEKEFNEIWCFDLRGKQVSVKGDESKKEGGKIFGANSKTSAVIVILVKNSAMDGCTIKYKDIGDYLSQNDKIKIIKNTKSISGINWNIIKPDQNHYWLDPPDDAFKQFMPMNIMFDSSSRGLMSSRDWWVYNSSKTALIQNMNICIDYFNDKVSEFELDTDDKQTNEKMIKWSDDLKMNFLKYRQTKSLVKFNSNNIYKILYRPFITKFCYYDSLWIKRIDSCHPPKTLLNGPLLAVGNTSVFIGNFICDLEIVVHAHIYSLYKNNSSDYNITDFTLNIFQKHYNDINIQKPDIFYYLYGILHNPRFIKKYSASMKNIGMQIPFAPDFKSFSEKGKTLAELHLSFESCKEYDIELEISDDDLNKVAKNAKALKFAYKDKSIIKLDNTILFKNVPISKYTVNDYTPIEWIVKRYVRTVDKKSEIVNDPLKDLDGKSIVSLIRRMLYIGTKSDEIIADLPDEFETNKCARCEFCNPPKQGLDIYSSTEKSTRIIDAPKQSILKQKNHLCKICKKPIIARGSGRPPLIHKKCRNL